MTFEQTVSICALVVSTLAFSVSIGTIVVNWHQKKIDNLMSLQQFLHQNGLSEARRSIREGECKVTLQEPTVLRVCSSFDFAGAMVRNHIVNKKLFLSYWAIPLNALDAPLNQIALDRTGDTVIVKEYYKDFWWLFGEAEKYIRDHRSPFLGLRLD